MYLHTVWRVPHFCFGSHISFCSSASQTCRRAFHFISISLLFTFQRIIVFSKCETTLIRWYSNYKPPFVVLLIVVAGIGFVVAPSVVGTLVVRPSEKMGRMVCLVLSYLNLVLIHCSFAMIGTTTFYPS